MLFGNAVALLYGGGSPYLKRMDMKNYQTITSLALLKFFVRGAD